MEWADYIELRAKKGFAQQKRELVAELKQAEFRLTHYIILEDEQKIRETRGIISLLCKSLDAICHTNSGKTYIKLEEVSQ